MKRALSLIIVLAMVLCMIPFSAFAADFGIAGDFVDGVITLVGGEEQTYLYTATEDGTVEVFAEAVIPEVAEGEEAPAVAEPYILVDGAEYAGAFAVTAGQSYEITFGDNAMIGGDVTVYIVFKGLPGTETNPKVLSYPMTPMYPNPTTDAIEAGVTEYYVLQGYAGQEVIISGLGVKVVTVEDGAVYGGEAATESVTFAVPTMIDSSTANYYVLKITNKTESAQTYTVTTVVKEGTMDNPKVVTDGTYTADLEAKSQGYYYSYTAEGDGTVSITVAAEPGWTYFVNNMTTGIYGDTQWSDSDPVVNPAVVEVSAGDNLVVMVNTYNAADEWNAPAGTVTTTFAFEAAAVEPSTIVIESLPYEATHTGVYEQLYSYTATANGYLYVATEGWVEMNVGDVWAEGYGDGYVLAMNEGDVANINLYAYWGEDTFTYNFSWMTEITPDGSYGFPFVAEIPADGTVVTLANDGDEAVYYVYTATEDCKIYNAFSEDTTDVAAGDSLMIYVAPGGIQVNYVLPVATYGGVNYYDLQAAISAAAAVATDSNKQTVVMNTSYVNENQTLILEPNVILDTYSNSITVKYLIGLSGSSLQNTKTRYNGTNLALAGQINVAKNNMILSETTVNPSSTTKMKVMPFWLPDSNCYTLGNFRVNDDAATATFENDGVFMRGFYHQGAGTLNNAIFKNDGCTDNGIRVVIRTEWMTDTGAYANDYTYLDSFVMTVAGGSAAYTYTLNGLVEALKVDMSTFKITPMIITDCGAIYYGNTIEYSAE